MKFWELISAFRGFEEQVSETLAKARWNQPYSEWYRNKSQLIDNQEREKLDAPIPEDLVLEVAQAIGDRQVFYLNEDILRNRLHSPNDTRLTVLEVVKRYGGSIVEGVMEYGSFKIES